MGMFDLAGWVEILCMSMVFRVCFVCWIPSIISSSCLLLWVYKVSCFPHSALTFLRPAFLPLRIPFSFYLDSERDSVLA